MKQEVSSLLYTEIGYGRYGAYPLRPVSKQSLLFKFYPFAEETFFLKHLSLLCLYSFYIYDVSVI